jgi:lipopolysaccharide export system protein LptC
MKNQDKTKLTLLLTGIILIILTYFYYPNLDKKNFLKNKNTLTGLEDKLDNEQSTAFENVKYNGLYNNKTFTVQADKAHMLKEDAVIVYMNNMHVIMYLDDGRILNITSNKGSFNKETYDCLFENNVYATDGETEIFSKNLDLLATKNSIEVYNDVKLNYTTGSLQADKIDYDFEKKYFKVSMFNDETIKMKVVK